MACSSSTHLFAAVPGRQRTAEIDGGTLWPEHPPASPGPAVPGTQAACGTRLQPTARHPQTPAWLLHGSRLSLPCSFCRKAPNELVVLLPFAITSAPLHGSRRPRQERPSPPVLPDRIRTGPNQQRFVLCLGSVSCVPRSSLCIAVLHPLRLRLKAPLSYVSMDVVDVAICPPNVDRHGWWVLVPKMDLDTNLLYVLPRLSGLLCSALRLASLLRTEITSRYLTGEAGWARMPAPEHPSRPPLLDLASPRQVDVPDPACRPRAMRTRD
jgi:hypothetical protein